MNLTTFLQLVQLNAVHPFRICSKLRRYYANQAKAEHLCGSSVWIIMEVVCTWERGMRMELQIDKMELKMKDISGSTFNEVKAKELYFDNVNLSKTKINNANMSRMTLHDINASGIGIRDANLSGAAIQHANMSHMKIDHVHLFGTEFVNIVLPQEGDGNHNPDGNYQPIVFNNCDLTNMEINNCNITGLKINGILIEELLKNK